jgi:titin
LSNQIGIGISGAQNTVGGTTAGARNIISGNSGGAIDIKDSVSFGNVVLGNYIGTDPTGKLLVVAGSSNGIEVNNGAHDNTIGGTAPGAGNVIDTRDGVFLLRTSNDVIQGNLIGTDNTGTARPGNSDGIAFAGVLIEVGNNNLVGGTTPGAGNTIAFCGGEPGGVDVDSGTGNSILGNSIYSNTPLGISLNSANNANDNQTPPVLTGVSTSSSGTTISGTLASAAGTTFRVEFFANQSSDLSGNGQGQTVLGYANVTNGSFTATGLAALPAGENYVSATATDLSTGDTSQFAQDLLAAPTVTTISSSANPSFFGQTVTLTATVAATVTGVGTPSGSVDFVDTTTGLIWVLAHLPAASPS